MKPNNGELRPDVVENALTAAGINGKRAEAIRAALNDTLVPDSLGLTGFGQGDQARLRLVNDRQAPERDESLLSVRLETEAEEDTEQRFVDEPHVLDDGVVDQIESDPVNLDHRMAREVNPDTIDETQIHPDFFASETVAEDLREMQRRERIVLMRTLRRNGSGDNGDQPDATIDRLSPSQSAVRLERFGTPRSRRKQTDSRRWATA